MACTALNMNYQYSLAWYHRVMVLNSSRCDRLCFASGVRDYVLPNLGSQDRWMEQRTP